MMTIGDVADATGLDLSHYTRTEVSLRAHLLWGTERNKAIAVDVKWGDCCNGATTGVCRAAMAVTAYHRVTCLA